MMEKLVCGRLKNRTDDLDKFLKEREAIELSERVRQIEEYLFFADDMFSEILQATEIMTSYTKF